MTGHPTRDLRKYPRPRETEQPPDDAPAYDGRDYGEPMDPHAPVDFSEGRKYRPEIQVVKGAIHEAVDAANDLLADPSLQVFARAGRFVRAVEYRSPPATLGAKSRREGNAIRPDGSIVVRELGQSALTEVLTRAARWVKWVPSSKALASIDCPVEVARMLIDRQGYRWKVPPLKAVIRAPVLRADFTVLSEPGYDTATGLLLVTDRHWPLVPPAPTRQDAVRAIGVLMRPLEALPFVDATDRAAAAALLITAAIRPMLGTAPMFAVTAPAAGTGKSLAIDVASILATGKPAVVITPSRDEAEMEKRLGASAIEGDAVIAIDNVSFPLESDQLCQFLTQTEVKVRVLGRSENVTVPSTALITATGNNLSLVGDLVRRTIRIRLDAAVERPDERRFDFDALELALSTRGEMLAAALTILKAYHRAGSPDPAPAMGSFEAWSQVVRSALMWAGLPDPRGDVEDMRGEDPETAGLREIMNALPALPFTANDIKTKMAFDDDLRAALSGFFDRSGVFSSVRFAGYLRRFKGRIVDGRCIRLDRL